jgi:cyanophycinase-like exopeptidase
MNGSLALVGSGEYLPAMAAFEKSLLADGIANGKQSTYVQIPTAAGRESQDSLNYWKNLGQQQADRIGVQPIFLPIYTRDDAFKQEHVDAIKNSALMYMSGGDPHHLAEVLIDTLCGLQLLKTGKAVLHLLGAVRVRWFCQHRFQTFECSSAHLARA